MATWDDFDVDPPTAPKIASSHTPPPSIPRRTATELRQPVPTDPTDDGASIFDDGVQYADDDFADYKPAPDNAFDLPDPAALLNLPTAAQREHRRPLGRIGIVDNPDDEASATQSGAEKRQARIAARAVRNENRRAQREADRATRETTQAERKAVKAQRTLQSASGPRPPRRRAIVAGAIAVVLVASGIWGVSFIRGQSDPAPASEPVAGTTSQQTPPRSAPTTTALSGPPAISALGASCPGDQSGSVTTGRGEGGFVGGPEVIKHFQYGYYAERSGRVAREVVRPDAAVGSEAQLNASIGRLPNPTQHCLQITDRGDGLWAVQLIEVTPLQRTVYPQLVRTVELDGRTWIVSIEADKEGA